MNTVTFSKPYWDSISSFQTLWLNSQKNISIIIKHAHRCSTEYSLYKNLNLIAVNIFYFYSILDFPILVIFKCWSLPTKIFSLWGLPTYSLKNNFSMCSVYKIFLIVHVHWCGEIFTGQWQIKSLSQNRMRNITLSGLWITVISANQKIAGNKYTTQQRFSEQ